MSELGLRRPAAGKSQRQISPSAWALATARTQRRTFLMLRARRFGQPSSRVWIYALRGCFSIFASLQPKLPANYAESPGEKQDRNRWDQQRTKFRAPTSREIPSFNIQMPAQT